MGFASASRPPRARAPALRLTLSVSKGEARRLVQGGGIKRNDEAINDANLVATEADLTADGYIKLSAGKKRHTLVRVK